MSPRPRGRRVCAACPRARSGTSTGCSSPREMPKIHLHVFTTGSIGPSRGCCSLRDRLRSRPDERRALREHQARVSGCKAAGPHVQDYADAKLEVVEGILAEGRRGVEPPPARTMGLSDGHSTQNSLPSTSRITTRSCPSLTTVAPSCSSRDTSSWIAPGARRSKCSLFLAVLGSGTRANQRLGPPQPGASTNALSDVDSSSTSSPHRSPEGGHRQRIRAVEGHALDEARHRRSVANLLPHDPTLIFRDPTVISGDPTVVARDRTLRDHRSDGLRLPRREGRLVDMTPEERFAALADEFAGQPGVRIPDSSARRAFGSSALKVERLDLRDAERRLSGGQAPARPRRRAHRGGTGGPYDAGKGRPMAEWLTVMTADDHSWLALAREAMEFVASRKG